MVSEDNLSIKLFQDNLRKLSTTEILSSICQLLEEIIQNKTVQAWKTDEKSQLALKCRLINVELSKSDSSLAHKLETSGG